MTAIECIHALADGPVNCAVCKLRLERDILSAERERLRIGLDKAAYALFEIKRLVPEAVREYASDAHVAACVILNELPKKPVTK